MSSLDHVGPERWMLVPHDVGDDASGRHHLPKLPVLRAVARRGAPRIVEATVVPAALFVLVGSIAGTAAAMLAVLVWGYGVVGWRLVRRRPVPALLALTTFGLTVKTLVGLLSGSVFAYFLQPVATMVAVGLVFFGSVLLGRPVVAHVAHDFCPIPPEVAARPTVVRLFAGLTLLWGGAQLVNAASTYGMLVALPVPVFVALKTVTSFAVTGAAVAVTVTWALRAAKRERLVFAVAPVEAR